MTVMGLAVALLSGVGDREAVDDVEVANGELGSARSALSVSGNEPERRPRAQNIIARPAIAIATMSSTRKRARAVA